MTFGEDYYVQTEYSRAKSLRQKKYEILAEDLINHLSLDTNMRILDFGCGTGGLVHVLKKKGFKHIKGTDISYWAIQFGQKNFELSNEIEYCNMNLLTQDFDVILMLDVLEYVPTLNEIRRFLGLIKEGIRLVVRVPVSVIEGNPYYLEIVRNDVTRVQCHTESWWHLLLEETGFKLDNTLSGSKIYESEGIFARVYTKCK